LDEPTYLSLFSGIGGLDLAVEAHGFRCVGQVEWDAHCTRVLERWWPTVPRWGDVTEFNATAYAGGSGQQGARPRIARNAEPARTHAPVDLIIGGFPCQPASTAGRRKGTADDRWLWPEVARVVGELRPRALLVENVPGLLTVNGGRAFSEIIGTLADLGYDATWTSLRASDVGACHKRQRIFLLAHAPGFGRGALGAKPTGFIRASIGGSGSGGVAPHADHGGHGSQLRPPGLTGVHAGDSGAEPRGADRGRFAWGAYEPAVRRWERVMGPAPMPVDDKGRLAPSFVEWMQGFEPGWIEGMTRTQALKALGNAVVPQQGAAAFSILTKLAEVAA